MLLQVTVVSVAGILHQHAAGVVAERSRTVCANHTDLRKHKLLFQRTSFDKCALHRKLRF